MQKEYQIGAFFTIDNSTYKTVKAHQKSCIICEFKSEDKLCFKHICTENERSDKNDVAFILYDTLDEYNND